MSEERSALLFLIGLAGVALFIFVISSVQQWIRNCSRHTEDKERDADDGQAESAPERHERGTTALIGRIDSVTRAIHAYHNKRDSHERARARGDKKTLIVLMAAAGFSAAAFIAGGVADMIFYGQLKVAQEEQRAWIAPYQMVLRKPLTLDPPIVNYLLLYKNIGKRPATDLNIKVHPIVQPHIPENAAFPSITDESECRNFTGWGDHVLVYPLDPQEKYFNGVVKLDDADIDKLPDVLVGRKTLTIVACFLYKNAGAEVHRTGSCFFAIPNLLDKRGQWTFSECPEGNFAE